MDGNIIKFNKSEKKKQYHMKIDKAKSENNFQQWK